MKRSRQDNNSDDKPTYDMPNMAAVANETRRLNDPKATYPLAVQAREAQARGAALRGQR